MQWRAIHAIISEAKKCTKTNNLPPMNWAKYKIYFDSRNTAEENHQRVEEILSQPTFADNLPVIHDELYYLNAQVQRNK